MRVYLDLDGVMADFDRHFREYFNADNKQLSDQKMWSMINSYPSFFRNLPPCEGAIKFFHYLNSNFNVSILTACPKSNYQSAAIQKREWVREHLSVNVTVIPMLQGKNKGLFMHQKGDILIDDFEKNCVAWNELGGVSIVHENFEKTNYELITHTSFFTKEISVDNLVDLVKKSSYRFGAI